jgi:hypothetical protein
MVNNSLEGHWIHIKKETITRIIATLQDYFSSVQNVSLLGIDHSNINGIVQCELSGVEIRLKRGALMYYITVEIFIFI